MEQLLHTPEGVRDLVGLECAGKLALEKRLHKVFELYGYHDIQTPTFEYFDVFGKEIGTTPSRELYKFFDKEGETLVLRPDFTPSIARAAATVFGDERLPIRLCYTGNTFVNYSESYQGRMREITQMGAELMGEDSALADAEMLAMVIDSLKAAGLSDFQVSVGNVDYFRTLVEEAGLDEQKESNVRRLIGNRNFFGLEEYLDQINVSESAKQGLVKLEDLYGSAEVLDIARSIAPNEKAVAAVQRLEDIYRTLGNFGVQDYITFDFSMSGIYGYYTGVIFRGYTYGTGDAIVKGGRYDHLLEKFGKKSPSIGFALVIDELILALSRQHIEIPRPKKLTCIVYDRTQTELAIRKAIELRKSETPAELILYSKGISVREYKARAYASGAGMLLLIEADGTERRIDL